MRRGDTERRAAAKSSCLQPRNEFAGGAVCQPSACADGAGETRMFKVLGWIAGIVFLIGLAVVVGIFDLIF
jgi:hypothetical protein